MLLVGTLMFLKPKLFILFIFYGGTFLIIKILIVFSTIIFSRLIIIVVIVLTAFLLYSEWCELPCFIFVYFLPSFARVYFIIEF
jgi:hypothetical protein